MSKSLRRGVLAGLAALPALSPWTSKRAQAPDFPAPDFRGGPAMADLMAGQVDLYFGGLSTALPHARAGKMRALGQTSLERSAAAADIPTIAESGLPGYEAAISYGVFLPAGAPKALVERLHAAVDATIRSPDVARKFVELGADPQFGSPAEFAAYVAEDFAKWARLAKEAGLKAE